MQNPWKGIPSGPPQYIVVNGEPQRASETVPWTCRARWIWLPVAFLGALMTAWLLVTITDPPIVQGDNKDENVVVLIILSAVASVGIAYMLASPG